MWPAALAHSAHNGAWGILAVFTATTSPVVVEEYLVGDNSVLILLGTVLVAGWLGHRLGLRGRLRGLDQTRNHFEKEQIMLTSSTSLPASASTPAVADRSRWAGSTYCSTLVCALVLGAAYPGPLALGNVTLVEGSFADDDVLREGFRSCDGAYVNIDGFNTGEKTETYWTIRSYEIALEESIKFFVHGNLDYALKKSGYHSKFRTGHYDGKGRMAEWILSQNQSNGDRMGAAVFTTGPYIEMADLTADAHDAHHRGRCCHLASSARPGSDTACGA